MVQAKEFPLINSEELEQSARDHFAEYGAWTEDEIGAWSRQELTALILQEVSACHNTLTESFSDDDGNLDWEAYNETEGGMIYPGNDGEMYLYLGI